LLPDRLLAPINPIVNPRRTNESAASNSIPRNPQVLSALLRKSAVDSVTEVNNFKSLWTSADMQDIWHKVDEKLAETKGAFPQVEAGMWRVDYAELLKEMDEKDQKENDKKGGVVEMEVDNELPPSVSSIYGSAEQTDPKRVVESFQARQIPGFRVASTRNESTIVVSLGLAGLSFEIQEALTTTTTTTTTETTSETTTTNTTNKPEYRVSTRQHLPLSKPTASAGTSRLETAIVQQLNSRPRKWDLRYLLVRLPPPIHSI
jgi:hypothetical protein